jgi:hypothetical protein
MADDEILPRRCVELSSQSYQFLRSRTTGSSSEVNDAGFDD